MKLCTKCKILKSLNNFVKNKLQNDGLHYICKECHKVYKEQNKQILKEKHKNWLLNNKEHIHLYNKEYNFNNPKKKEYTKNWLILNPNYQKNWKKDKYKNDVNFKLLDNIRSRLNHSLFGNIKSESTLNLIGCKIEELKYHLEKQFLPEMNWSNHGEIWEIDHIKGCCNFDLSKDIEQKQCFHFSNLQPLFKTTKIAEQLKYNHIGNRNKSKKQNGK